MTSFGNGGVLFPDRERERESTVNMKFQNAIPDFLPILSLLTPNNFESFCPLISFI
jgi:hypothetical protein